MKEVLLGDVCEKVVVGHVGSTSSFYCGPEGVPFLRTQNVGDGELKLNDIKYVVRDFHEKLKKSQLQAGDIIISRVISDRLRCAIITEELNGSNCANIVVVRPSGNLSNGFLKYYVNSEIGQRKVLKLKVGSAQSVVNTKIIKNWSIPLPPLETQQKIASILDAADAYRQKTKTLIAKYDQLAQSLFLDMFGDPFENTKGWETKTLNKLTTKITDGEHGTVERLEEGRPYLMARNVGHDGLILEEMSYISEADHRRIYQRCNPETGDLLLVCVGATIGRCCTVPDGEEFSLARSVALIKPKPELLKSDFMLFQFKDPHFQHQIMSRRNTSAQAGLYTGQIRQLRLIHPPLGLQLEFGERVRSIVRQKSVLLKSLSKSEDLFNSLLQRAFKGELVN